jgi:hypothetical protein
LNEKVAAPDKKTEVTTGGIRCADHATPSIRKVGTNFADKRRSFGGYSLVFLVKQFYFVINGLKIIGHENPDNNLESFCICQYFDRYD